MARRRSIAAAATVIILLASLAAWLAPRPDRSPPGAMFVDGAGRLGLDRILSGGSPEKLFIIENVGSGAAFLDFDGDGRLDIFLANAGVVKDGRILPGPGAALYRQTEGERFEEVASRAGIIHHGWGTGVAVGDIEGDGDPDIFLGTLDLPLLFRNEGGRFLEWGREAGFHRKGFASSAVFLDYDRDGNLDLYVARYLDFDMDRPPNDGRPCQENGISISCGPTLHRPLPHLLYRGMGGGKFEDVTERAGLGTQEGSYGLGAASGDLDGDRWTDIYAANDTTANFLWRNRGDGTFEDMALLAGCALGENGQGQSGMGTDLGDADGDGRLEIFVSNYSEEYNAYYSNLGSASFADRTYSSGLNRGCYLTMGWGSKFFDWDSDGALDLFVANGHVHPRAAELNPVLSYEQPILFYRGDGRGGFTLLTGEPGPDALKPRAHRGAAVGDPDRDGDLDILITVLDRPPVLLLNRLDRPERSLTVRLRGVRSNREGIGARLELMAEGLTQVREVSRGGGYLSASEAVAHFGLGSRPRAESLRILWPSGREDLLGPLDAGESILVEEGGAIISRTRHRPRGW